MQYHKNVIRGLFGNWDWPATTKKVLISHQTFSSREWGEFGEGIWSWDYHTLATLHYLLAVYTNLGKCVVKLIMYLDVWRWDKLNPQKMVSYLNFDWYKAKIIISTVAWILLLYEYFSFLSVTFHTEKALMQVWWIIVLSEGDLQNVGILSSIVKPWPSKPWLSEHLY